MMEPPSRLEFSNSSGGWLDCSASGSPQPSIDWLSVDGTSVGDVGGVRRVLRNGTLVLLPFPATAYRQDIHSTIYRCVASNTVGRVISRDVQVRAGKFIASLIRTSAVQFPPNDESTSTQTNGKALHETHLRTQSLTLTRTDNETQPTIAGATGDGQLFRFRSNTLSITL